MGMAIWPILLGATPVAAGVLSGLWRKWAEPSNRRRRALRRTPFTKVEDLEEGRVAKVRGRAEPFDAPLLAPLTRRASVHYLVLGATPAPDGGHRLVELEQRAVDFWVKDDTGRLLVRDGRFARMVAREMFGPGPEYRATRRELSKHFAPELGGAALQFVLVASIDIGEEITVRGRIGGERMTEPGAPRYRDAVVRIPALVEDPRVERIVSDLPEIVGGPSARE